MAEGCVGVAWRRLGLLTCVSCSADAADPRNALNGAALSRLEVCCVPLTSLLQGSVR
jgi:hypothetical protein